MPSVIMHRTEYPGILFLFVAVVERRETPVGWVEIKQRVDGL